MLIRSPEVSLAVIASFLTCIKPQLSNAPILQTKLLPAILSSAKSINAITRLAALNLFDILFTLRIAADFDSLPIAEQVFTPLKMGKTSSPDHRTSLFIMLGNLLPQTKLSTELVTLTLTLLSKESNELTIKAMMKVLENHLPTSLIAGEVLGAVQVTALIKGMQEVKPTIRRAVCFTVGAILWKLTEEGEKITEAMKVLGVGILPGLESGLKIVTTNPLNAPAGPLEGFVAVAILKGRIGRWGVPAIG